MNQLRAERGFHCLTQGEAADKFGVSAATYRRWESGDSSIPSSKLIEMAKEFGCSSDYLIGLSTVRNPQ